MKIGERIKKRRQEIGMSADRLGEKIGVSRSTIYRYESGDIEKLPTDVLGPIAKALNVSPAYLMGWEDGEESFNLFEFWDNRYNAEGNISKEVQEIEDDLKVLKGFRIQNEKDVKILKIARNAMNLSEANADLILNTMNALSRIKEEDYEIDDDDKDEL